MKKKDSTVEQMRLEGALLKAMSVRKDYEKFIKTLDVKRLNPITSILLADYKRYYDKYKKDINFDDFYLSFCDWHKRDLDDIDLNQYRETVFPAIMNSVPSPQLFVSLLEKEAASKIETLALTGVNEKAIIKVLHDLNEKKKQYIPAEADEEVFSLGGLDVSVLDASNGLEWALPSLQAGLNSLMPGQFIAVAADSGVGKSAFCITQVVHTFKYLNKIKETRPILYLTSEDTKEDLACRFLACLYKDKVLGGFEQIITDYDKVGKTFKEHFNDELFVGMQIRGHGDLYRLDQKVQQYNPRLIIVDMLDKLSESDHITDLTKCYQHMRSIANDGFAIIGTTQAGNTSYQDKEKGGFKHRKWLSDKDMAGSKGGGKQGAAYCIISIGKDDDMPDVRYIQTTKKKRGQHVRSTCKLEELYSCYSEIF